MDLWIRSQNKKELRPNPKLGIEGIKDEFYIVDRFNFDDATILGIYKTEERALEVLDEIQKILTPIITYKQKEPKEIIQNGLYQVRQEVDMKIQELSTYVYEMPKE